VSQRLQIARIVKRRLFIGTKAGSASSISFGLLPDWTRWWWARLKFSGRPKRRTRGRVLPEQRGLICTACSSARFALQSRSAHTRKLRAADLAHRIFGQLSNCKVLVLGAGETSERTARALVSRGASDLRVSNRSSDRAHDLAQLVGGRAIPFEEWPEQCREIDILITSTSSETPLLTLANLEPMLRDRIDRPLFIIDIAVPRDVDPEVNELDGVYLYDIDSLQSVAEQSLALRRQQIAAAETIIAEHVADFVDSISRGLHRASKTSEHPSVGEAPLRTSEL